MDDPPKARQPSFAAWQEDAIARLQTRRDERAVEEQAKLAARTPYEIQRDEWVRRLVETAPPLSAEQKMTIGLIFASVPPANPQPGEKPKPPRRAGKSLDPRPGVLYGRHLRATPGTCQRCRQEGSREVDHCHEHHVVRGLICPGCNRLAEKSMGDAWLRNCLWCAWDIWLARELAR